MASLVWTQAALSRGGHLQTAWQTASAFNSGLTLRGGARKGGGGFVELSGSHELTPSILMMYTDSPQAITNESKPLSRLYSPGIATVALWEARGRGMGSTQPPEGRLVGLGGRYSVRNQKPREPKTVWLGSTASRLCESDRRPCRPLNRKVYRCFPGKTPRRSTGHPPDHIEPGTEPQAGTEPYFHLNMLESMLYFASSETVQLASLPRAPRRG